MTTAFLVGRLGSDPEKQTIGDKEVYRFLVAKDDYRVKQDDDTYKTHTSWVRCTARGKRGEVLFNNLHKGDMVFFLGDYIFDSVQTDCEKHNMITYVNFNIDDFKFISPNKSATGKSTKENDKKEVEDIVEDDDDDLPV